MAWGDANGAALGRINGKKEARRFGIVTLTWISHPEPSMPDEPRHALPVEVRSSNLNSDNIPSIRALLANFQGPMVVDKEASTAQLIPSRVPPGSRRAFWYISPNNCRNLSESAAGQGSLDLSLSRSPAHPPPNTDPSLYWGKSKQKGTFRIAQYCLG